MFDFLRISFFRQNYPTREQTEYDVYDFTTDEEADHDNDDDDKSDTESDEDDDGQFLDIIGVDKY